MKPFLCDLFSSPEVFLKSYWYLLLFGMKGFLIYYFRYTLLPWHIFWLPAFFLPELLTVLLLETFAWTLNKSCLSSSLKKVFHFSVLLFGLLGTCIIYSAVLSSIYEIGFVIKWYTSMCTMMLLESDGGMFWEEAAPFLIILGVQLALIGIGVYLSCKKPVIQYHELVPQQSPELGMQGLNLAREKKSYYKRAKLTLFSLMIAYLLGSIFFCRTEEVEPNITLNPIVTLFRDVGNFFRLRCTHPAEWIFEKGQNMKWFDNCRTFDEVIKQARSPVQTCFRNKKYVTDFEFIKRTPTSPIKNVVLFYLESNRADVNPFNYSSPFARKLNAQAMLERNITPFMEQLVKKARYSSQAKSVSSYTIKAMLSGLCSTYPFPKNHISEHLYKMPRKCLPKLLKKYGNFSTAFIEPMDLAFDSHDHLFNNRIKFDYMFTGENMKRGEAGEPPRQRMSFMSYEDGPFKKPMMEWVDKQVEENKPFFLFYSSSVTHWKFTTPDSWETRNYAAPGEDVLINKYLNSLSYMDNFIKEVMTDFETRGLTKNTLFIFFGDHGLSLGEHNMWITTDIPYETQFTVPAILYSDNEQWQQRFPPETVSQPWTTLDILPTVLDALRFDGKSTDNFTGEYAYDGQSMLRQKYEKRAQLSLANPGMSNLIARENGMKVIFPGVPDKKEEYYNIAADPYEERKLKYKELPTEFKEWINEMRLVKNLYINKTTEWYQDGILPISAD